MEWQPIETAPKDGTEIVLWCENCNSLIHQAKWIRDNWREYRIGGFDCMDWYQLEPYEKPSHWMIIIPPNAEHQARCKASPECSCSAGYDPECQWDGHHDSTEERCDQFGAVVLCGACRHWKQDREFSQVHQCGHPRFGELVWQMGHAEGPICTEADFGCVLSEESNAESEASQ